MLQWREACWPRVALAGQLLCSRRRIPPAHRLLPRPDPRVRGSGRGTLSVSLSFSRDDGPALVESLAREGRAEELPDGFVAHSTYWLVHGETKVVGVSNLRHELTPFLRHEGGHIGYGVRPSAGGKGYGTEILRQTLSRAAEFGLVQVLIACDAENERSIKTIVRNGGRLEADNVAASDGCITHRHWIYFDPERA